MNQTEIEAQYAWQRKGKKYKTKYLSALIVLLGDNIDQGWDKKALNFIQDERSLKDNPRR